MHSEGAFNEAGMAEEMRRNTKGTTRGQARKRVKKQRAVAWPNRFPKMDGLWLVFAPCK
jgi:hypothetical protein